MADADWCYSITTNQRVMSLIECHPARVGNQSNHSPLEVESTELMT